MLNVMILLCCRMNNISMENDMSCLDEALNDRLVEHLYVHAQKISMEITHLY